MHTKTKRRFPARAEFWAGHIQKWQHSRQTKARYCIEHGLSRHAFYYWFKKFDGKDHSQGGTIVPTNFTIIKTEPSSYQPIKLNVSERFQVEIGTDFRARTLVKLIKTLEDIG